MISRLLLALAIIAALGGAAMWFYDKGGDAVEIKIERQNNVAGTKSENARDAYDRCVSPDIGGVYDYATGKCRRPSTRGRN